MYIAKLKDGPKRVKKTFSMILERFLKWYDEGGENEITSKMIFLKLKYFSPLRIWTSPLFEDTLLAFLFLPLFFLFFKNFSLFFFCLPFEDLGGFDDI
jgi:hypothetical protein